MDNEKYILSIDQGTTSTRVAIIDDKLNIKAIEQIEHEQIVNEPGWTEHDPYQIIQNINLLIDRISHHNKSLIKVIKAIGITNQRETCLAWDKNTGDHICNAIVWHDMRTHKIVEELITKYGDKDKFKKICGLPINTYFSAVKIRWMIDNIPDISERIKNQDKNLCFGTIDSWIIYKLTGNYYTDVTNASRTMLMNLEKLDWDDYMLEVFNIPKYCLPVIKSSTDFYGTVINGNLKNIPIYGVIGDQQSASIGHNLQNGEVKNTYGTGCFMLMNTGDCIIHSNYGLLTTVLYKKKDEIAQYAMEGAVESAGSTIVWLKDNLHLFDDYEELKTKFYSVKDNGGVFFVPSFSGLYTPHWDCSARGLIIGLTNSTKQGHIIRASYEGISLRSYEVIKSFELDSKQKVTKLRVDGGLTSSEEFLQTQSDIAGVDVVKQKEKEITIIGCAIVAGLGVDIWKKQDLDKLIKIENSYFPTLAENDRKTIYKKWEKAIIRAKDWLD